MRLPMEQINRNTNAYDDFLLYCLNATSGRTYQTLFTLGVMD